jgi:hypothetical protein
MTDELRSHLSQYDRDDLEMLAISLIVPQLWPDTDLNFIKGRIDKTIQHNKSKETIKPLDLTFDLLGNFCHKLNSKRWSSLTDEERRIHLEKEQRRKKKSLTDEDQQMYRRWDLIEMYLKEKNDSE